MADILLFTSPKTQLNRFQAHRMIDLHPKTETKNRITTRTRMQSPSYAQIHGLELWFSRIEPHRSVFEMQRLQHTENQVGFRIRDNESASSM